MNTNPFRELPSVSELATILTELGTGVSTPHLNVFARQSLGVARDLIELGKPLKKAEVIRLAIRNLFELDRDRLAPLINATGVIIHTNLGRSPVSASTATAMSNSASGYVALELDPETNERGGRMSEISRLMSILTGAESTLVVNNNAAAVLLALSALASGKEVIVSRGEAVEIGGGFRIPDVMRQSGANLVEVGTTNRTYLRDYADAITPSTAAFLKVHASNFTIDGFTATTSIDELAVLGKDRAIPLIDDLGSGALLDTSHFGLASEPTIAERIAAGADVITASGDKLLGGPQAGIIAGRADLIDRIARHPLARAVRADKTVLAGLAATLRHYLAGNAVEQIPIWRMISAQISELHSRAEAIVASIHLDGMQLQIVETRATVGGGSLPGQTLPSSAIAIQPSTISIDELARALRIGSLGVFGRIERDRLMLDLRTVLPEDDVRLTAALCSALSA